MEGEGVQRMEMRMWWWEFVGSDMVRVLWVWRSVA
jgi:hypothetical protein